MRVVTSCEIANFDRSSIEGMLTSRSVAIFVNGPAKSSRFPGRFLFRNRKLIEAQN